jgi:hypothetical protein
MYHKIKSLYNLNLDNSSSFKYFVLFVFCFAVIFGAAFTLLLNYKYDMAANPDLKTYLGLANFDFHQSPVRRYRIIIPFLAAGVNYFFHPAFSFLKPWNFQGPDFSLCMSFLVVNCIIMSLFGIIIYRLCKIYGASVFGSLIGLLAVLTCRWTPYFAGIPSVDSLYLLIIAMVLLGLKSKNNKLIIAAIFLGPFAKESFLFISPLLLVYSTMNRWKLAGWFMLSAIIIFSFRYYFDIFNNLSLNEGLKSDFEHTANITASLHRLFSFHGIYEIFSIFGVWGVLFLFLIKRGFRNGIILKMPDYMIFYLVIVLIHALLSTELARMFYLAIPVIAIWISAITDRFLNKYTIKTNLKI